MCAAIIPSASAAKIMVVKPADQDGSLTTVYIATHSHDGFQSSGVLDVLEGPQSQLPHRGDAAESSKLEDELQARGISLRTPPAGDFSRRELPPYSLLLYRPGASSSMEHPPLILTTTSDGAGIPFLDDILASQSLPQSQVLVTTRATLTSTNPGCIASSTHCVDPAWLQVLSHILSSPSSDGNKGEERIMSSSSISETHPSPVSSISTPSPAFTTKTEGVDFREMEAAMKIPLAELTNKLTKQQSQMVAHVVKDNHVSPPVSSQLDSHSQAEFIQTFVNKHDSTMKPSVTSNDAENQAANPHEKTTTIDQATRQGFGTSRLSNVNMPVLANSPLLCHEGSGGPMRESHNLKERRRRARIKDACNLMRQLVPGMSHKTDKATVFEFSARYIHFLKSFVGSSKDKDFLVKYSPY